MDLKPLITLLAIVNPLAIVPFFIHYTQGFDRRQRQRTVLISSISAFAVIATCGFFQALQVSIVLLLSWPSRAINALKLLVVLVSTPVGRSHPGKRKTVSNHAGVWEMRASAKVAPGDCSIWI